jgi:hypothetical protein
MNGREEKREAKEETGDGRRGEEEWMTEERNDEARHESRDESEGEGERETEIAGGRERASGRG